MNKLELQKTANEIRKGIVSGVHAAKAGHPGGSLSAADIFTYLYFEEMNVDPKNPKDPDRDRFVLSKGHTAPGLYAALAEKGYFPKEDLLTLRHLGSYLQGHPDMKHIPGVDMSSGSLGQGISAAVGMALGAKLQNKAFRVYTLLGDGEIQEGQVWEAAMFAGAKHLDNLVVIVDNNGLQIDGNVADVNSPYPIDKKFEAFNFHVINVADGNDFDLGDGVTTKVLQLTQPEQTFVFENIPVPPVPSLLRDFSAPIYLDFDYTPEQLTLLLAHDSDPFNAWEAGQRLASTLILDAAAAIAAGQQASWPASFINAARRLLQTQARRGAAFVAEALTLPGEATLAEMLEEVNPDALHAARNHLRLSLAEGLRAKGHTVTFFAPPHCELREKNPDLNWQDLPDNFWAAKKTIERHFLAKLPGEEEAIITDTRKVVNTLNSLCVEIQ